MYSGQLVFAQLMDHLPWQTFRRIVERYGGDRRVRGPAELHRLLYLAAMSAAKTKTWRPLYEHYRVKGLSSTATFAIP